MGAVEGWLDPEDAVVTRQRVIPEGVDAEGYLEAQRHVFAETARLAAAVGRRAAGLDVEISGDGARVVAIIPSAPAGGSLRVGDVIIAVDDRPVELAADLVAALARRDVGDTVTSPSDEMDAQSRRG